MSFRSEVNFYNFNVDTLASYLVVKDWQGCWDYMHQLIESFSSKLDQSHNISIQKSFSDIDQLEYAKNFASLMGQLIMGLLTNPECKIDDKNYRHLIYIHEVIHTFFHMAGLGNTDELVQSIIKNQKKISKNDQKKLLLLLSLQTDIDIIPLIKKTSIEYRSLAICAYMGYLKIYDEKIYNNKIKLYDIANDIEKSPLIDNKSVTSILSPYFSCSYLFYDKKHIVKKYINNAYLKYFKKSQRDLEKARQNAASKTFTFNKDSNKPNIIVLWEYFYDGHAMLRVWGPWVKKLEEQFNVINISHQDFENKCTGYNFKNIAHYKTIADMFILADSFKADMVIHTSVGMSFWSAFISNLRLAPTQIQCLGHPATTYSNQIDFVYGNAPMLNPRAFPNDKIVSDTLSLTYESRMSRSEVENLKISHYQKGSGKPIKASIIGSEIKVCAPFIQLLKELEDDSDFDIEFSFHMGTMGMDTLFAEQFFHNKFKNAKYTGWQPYENYLQSMLETDIVLNPFPFGHTNTIIDTLILGKPCIGLEGIEPASLTEKMILEEMGGDMREKFSATSIEDYKNKFKMLSAQILNGETHFYDRMEMYDKLHHPKIQPDYAQSIMWVHKNADKMKNSQKKLFTIGEDSF